MTLCRQVMYGIGRVSCARDSSSAEKAVLNAGSEVEVDMANDVLTELSSGRTFSLKPLGEVCARASLACKKQHCSPSMSGAQCTEHGSVQAAPVVDAGGIFEYARAQGMIKTA